MSGSSPLVGSRASIIEKETGAASERAMISGVFHNRWVAKYQR